MAADSTTGKSARAHGGEWALAALGVVFGDLGTSPLYSLQAVVQATGGAFTPSSALGVLSMIVWTLIITISIKYCLFVMRADNRGEGGILALMSLIGANGFRPGFKLLTAFGLLGAALIYGDGVITPAISVLSALEGVNVVDGAFRPFVMPAAVAILLGLFAAQRFGTAKIGRAFGPIMLLWFLVIGVIGGASIARHPAVVLALDPLYAIRFMAHSRGLGFLVLGGVFLCITGGEALYADMGHFGKGPVRRAWYLIVLPSLLLSYAGQTAFLIDQRTVSGNPFFQIAPSWSIYPLVGLATLATIIASQAIITGSFSMTRQAMQLGWLPGVAIRQTSDRIYGQIYVPVVNWLLMIATVATTIAFGSSDRLAGAYGTAVSTTMLLTTILLYRAMRDTWRWPTAAASSVAAVFVIVDTSFFVANLVKIADGGWLPLSFAAVLFLVMITWRSGTEAIRATLAQAPHTAELFLAALEHGEIPRVPGTTVFLTRSRQKVSRLIMDHARFVGVLPKHAIALSVVFENVPRITGPNCTIVDNVGEGLWHLMARFGFFEIPDLTRALRHTHGLDPEIKFDSAMFVGTRDLIVRRRVGATFGRWRSALFAFLYRNAVKTVDRFNLPPENVVEIARQIEI
ncbi:MAG TPA: KUP/HAK/KT family potassium transporter [Steroidobacteraceae bacterium]|jgi:KUP system potassium uptake protein|nr:KUP/HAK/KT family potassium transporter [Steroidobacteraceae bacterium]